MNRRSPVVAASAAVVLAVAASAQAAVIVGGVNSVVLGGVQVPNAPTGVRPGVNMLVRVTGNDAGGVVAVGTVTGVPGSTHAFFGKKDQATPFGIARTPTVAMSGAPLYLGGVDSRGNGLLVANVSNVLSAVVNNTVIAVAGGPKPAIGGTGSIWSTSSFDQARMTTGGTAYIVGRDGPGGNMIMGKYSGYNADGEFGTWSPALAAGDTIRNPDGTPFGTLAGGNNTNTTFDYNILRVADVSGTPTYITRAVVNPTPSGPQISALIANGKILASPSGVPIVTGAAAQGYAGTTYSNFFATDIASNGNFAYSGFTAGISNSFVAVNGAVVVKGGDTVAGITLPSGTGMVSAVDVNESGDLAFFYGNTTFGRHIFLKTSDGDVLIAIQGSTSVTVGVDTDGNGSPNSNHAISNLPFLQTNLYLSPRYTASNGAPSVDVYFAGTVPVSNGLAVFKATVAVPEPAALGLLAPAALALVARRRRNA